MNHATFRFSLFVLLLLTLALALAPILKAHLRKAIRAFIAFFFFLLLFLLRGLRFMADYVGSKDGVLLADLFASLALTDFWAMRRK
jgi:hypothetical protein